MAERCKSDKASFYTLAFILVLQQAGGNGIEPKREITSVGIDIGTSTTKIVFSRLTVGRRYGLSMLPQYQITERNIIYESPMHLTPLIGESQIDLPALQQILSAEYHSAALKPEEVDTGAVIITGETAVRPNADSILHQLAGSRESSWLPRQAGIWRLSLQVKALERKLIRKERRGQ